jgi:hypothetical protein
MMTTLEEKYILASIELFTSLDVRFDEVNMELFSYVVALNPSNSFVLFDAKKVCRLA